LIESHFIGLGRVTVVCFDDFQVGEEDLSAVVVLVGRKGDSKTAFPLSVLVALLILLEEEYCGNC
jgi:hypothetical protein